MARLTTRRTNVDEQKSPLLAWMGMLRGILLYRNAIDIPLVAHCPTAHDMININLCESGLPRSPTRCEREHFPIIVRIYLKNENIKIENIKKKKIKKYLAQNILYTLFCLTFDLLRLKKLSHK